MTSNKGGRPIRKRGYHRAIKRVEPWALLSQAIAGMTNDFARNLFMEQPEALYKPPSFSEFLKRET